MRELMRVVPSEAETRMITISPHQPVSKGVLVSGNLFTALQKDAEVGRLVAVDKLHVKVVKMRVDLSVDVEGLDLGPGLGVAAAG
jgi:hypothetical protein